MDTSGEKLLTAAVVMITIVLIAAFLLCIFMVRNGTIDDYTAMVSGGILSTMLMFVIVIYSAILNRNDESSAHAYEQFLDEKKRE